MKIVYTYNGIFYAKIIKILAIPWLFPKFFSQREINRNYNFKQDMHFPMIVHSQNGKCGKRTRAAEKCEQDKKEEKYELH